MQTLQIANDVIEYWSSRLQTANDTVIMYSDLLDVLGNQGSSSIARSGSDSDNHVAVSFKAGKMKMELQEVRIRTCAVWINGNNADMPCVSICIDASHSLTHSRIAIIHRLDCCRIAYYY